MQLKGIFFDLGGTLFRYPRRMGGGGIMHVLQALGIEAEPSQIGESWRRATTEVGTRYGQQDYFLHRDLFRDTLNHFLQGYDKQASEALMEEFHQRQLQSLVEHLPLRDECHDALAALKSRGLYLSIVSNIDDDYLDPLVDKHELHRHLDHWTSSEEAQSCKPHADIYHYSLAKADLHKDEVLFVGDSLHHDVAGAAAVGMRSARIVEEGVTTPLTHGLEVTAEPTYEIEALTDLLDIVDGLNNAGQT
ncbi:MAG: HAD family hydrolase [Pseudomonadota bacterium]